MARVIVFAADLSDMIAGTGARAGIRWGGPGDRPALTAAGIGATWLDRIDKGLRFVVAEEDGRIIGHNIYLTFDEVQQYDWLRISLRAEHDVYSSSAFVLPERRGQRLIADMKRFAARDFVAQGYRRMISVVRAGNEASMKAHARVGAVPLLTLTRVRMGSLILVWQGRSLRQVSWGIRPFTVTV